ncbi:hypothetical protein A2U01_0039794, partial [Trifolium medium]|nr:hypothetical protein [Trifolium medium]
VFEAMKRHDEEEPQCHRVNVIEEVVEDVFVEDTPSPPLERVLVNSWKYVFLGENRTKPIVISSLLNPFEEEELLKEAKTVNDSLEWDLNGMIPIYCLNTPNKAKDLDPVVQPREVALSTLEDLVKKEVIKLFETGMLNCMPDSLRVNPVDVTSKKEDFKKPPKRSIKKK